MMLRFWLPLLCALTFAGPAGAQGEAKRAITLADIDRLREIDTLALAPDGRRYAIFVREADPDANRYITHWYLGSLDGSLKAAGDGGDLRFKVRPAGVIVGEVTGPQAQWAPNGKSFAYLLERDGAVQIWRSSAETGRQEQITANDADVRDFVWSEDGRSLIFSVGPTRKNLTRETDERNRAGYRYDEDLWTFTDFLLPQMRPRPTAKIDIRAVDILGTNERPADANERAFFETGLALPPSGRQSARTPIAGAVLATARRPDGRTAWLRAERPGASSLRVVASAFPDRVGVSPAQCSSDVCTGAIQGLWWSSDGDRVLFLRKEGVAELSNVFYSWTVRTNEVRRLASAPDDYLRFCDIATADRVICVRETPVLPAHVAAFDLKTGNIETVGDVNPQFRRIRLGKVERIEWATPRFAWQAPGQPLHGVYPDRAYGYILYPPDFDPAKRYPVFIDPYVAIGFNRPGGEHPLHVYAAAGFVVLNLAFPRVSDPDGRLGGTLMNRLYAPEQGYPHLSMLAQSTLAGLDLTIARGFVDERNIGIGGVSHGTFVPLHMLQKADRITAISISSATWGPHEYYSRTRALRGVTQTLQTGGIPYQDWRRNPATPEGRAFWSGFDIADHVSEIEAPILMNISAEESYTLVRLIRNLDDAKRPYDTYVFNDESHIKWQPAHLSVIRARNLDWFRFWLQDVRDSDPAKADQYMRWDKLRALQCRNPRSVRDHCQVRDL